MLSAFSFRRALLLMVPIIAIKAILWLHTNNEFFFDGKLFLLQTLIRPLKYPAITLAGHALAFLALAIFALDSEARHIATFTPLILVVLGQILNEIHLGTRTVSALVALQLLLSHFYIPLNGEGMALALEKEEFSVFPAQMLMMNFGAWMTPATYIFWTIVALGTLFALRKLLKTVE